MMRKLIVLLIIVVTLTLSACEGNVNPSGNTTIPNTTGTNKVPTLTPTPTENISAGISEQVLQIWKDIDNMQMLVVNLLKCIIYRHLYICNRANPVQIKYH